MKRMWFLAVLGLGWIPGSVLAMCYTVYGPNSVVIWRDTTTPIDLSVPISQGMRKAFPAGSFLVIESETRRCTPVGRGDFFGPVSGMDVNRPVY
jgi:hypothetical protein